MRVKKWVREGKSKVLKDTNLERFDLYLHVEDDAELIDILKRLRRRHRAGQKLRDLLYAGMASEQANRPRLALPARASVPVETPTLSTKPSDDDMLKIATDRVLNQFG